MKIILVAAVVFMLIHWLPLTVLVTWSIIASLVLLVIRLIDRSIVDELFTKFVTWVTS